MSWFSKKSIISLIIEAVIFLGIISFGYQTISNKLKRSEQNIIAYKNQIEQLELKNGELLSTRDSYLMDKNQLEEELDITKKEIKELEKKLGSSLAYIAKIQSEIKIDTIETVKDSIIYINNTPQEIFFNYKDEWFSLKGTNNVFKSTTSLYDINMIVPLTLGLTNDYKLFIRSPNPYVYFTDMDGAVINGSKLIPKEKHWSFGIHGGFGVSYDMLSKNLGVGPYMGAGISYKF